MTDMGASASLLGRVLAVVRALRHVEAARGCAPGIVVGTLGVAGYREAVDAVRALARRAGKRTYTLLVGKPSPAKLANFPEVEVFVLVADPQARPFAAFP